MRLQRRKAVYRPHKIGGHDPRHQRGIHLATVEILAGSGAKNHRVGSTVRQRLATGVPVCHIEQAHRNVGAVLMHGCQTLRIAPAGNHPVAIVGKRFRQPGPYARACAGDQNRFHDFTLRLTPRTAQPSTGRCS